MTSQKLHRQIMRRVYYSYGISIVTNTMFVQGVVLGVVAGLLADWLHVASIIENFLAIPVGSVPQYITQAFYGALTHGEALTVAAVLVAGYISISVGLRLLNRMVFHKYHLINI